MFLLVRLTVPCAFLLILVDLGSAQKQQKLTQKQSPPPQCALKIRAGASNGKNVASGGAIILHHEPCRGFGPQTVSEKNSRRKAGCRNAAERLAQVAHKKECDQIVHGQCLKPVSSGKVAQADAACYALIKRPNGSFLFKLIKDCADGQLGTVYGGNLTEGR